MANLRNYGTAEVIREATLEEMALSVEAAEMDGGAGVIDVEGTSCYVDGDRIEVDCDETSEDYDRGTILRRRPNGDVLIGWDSGVQTWTGLEGLRAL